VDDRIVRAAVTIRAASASCSRSLATSAVTGRTNSSIDAATTKPPSSRPITTSCG
jgi:hypothetical protein